jgi:cell division protease FtsH
VTLDNPDIKGRKQILEVHSKGKPLTTEVDLQQVARQTVGFSGADLANLVNESAILAARRNRKDVGPDEFAESIDRVISGPERKSRVITAREREITAYHEAGHALVAHVLPDADPVAKVTIVARGHTGGYTRTLPEEDRSLITRNQLEARLAMAMGGRVAEELVFDEVTTGAGSDLEQATNIARTMVTRYGMSEAGASDVRQARGAGVPGAGDIRAAGLQRQRSPDHRRRGAQAHRYRSEYSQRLA